MKRVLGEKGLQYSWQSTFPEKVKCRKSKCNGMARIGFVVKELSGEVEYVCDLHRNKKNEMWLHDACAVAIYFCEKCLEVTAEYNQA